MNYVFDWTVIPRNFDRLLGGAYLTGQLTVVTVALGFVLAVALAIIRTSGPSWVRMVVTAYVEFLRNTPFLVQLIVLFFGLPSLGVQLSANQAAVIAMTLNFSAYGCEIVRSGIDAVAFGQIEAGRALGFHRGHIYRHVVLPQALNTCYPALASQFTIVMLGSSAVSAVGADELTATANIIQSESYRAFEIYIVVIAMYLALTLLMRSALALIYRLAIAPPGRA